MSLHLTQPRLDARIQAAWQTQVALARQTPGILPTLVRQRQELLPRFASAYRQLRALPCRWRRQLQRRFQRSLAGVALLVALGQGAVWADTITVNGTCTLINAIVTANTDSNTGGCVQTPAATAGADTIVLPASSTHTLTAVNNTTYDETGLPVVSTEITIEGNNSTILRDSGASGFRIFAVGSTGSLTLKQTTISGGTGEGTGGGMYNYKGVVTVTNSTVSGNFASYSGSGGIHNNGGSVTVTNSTVSGNSSPQSGGGVFNSYGIFALTNSTVSGNSAGGSGGGVFTNNGTVALTNSTVSGNSAGGSGGGVFDVSYGTVTLTNSTVSGNSTSDDGGGVYSYRGTVIVTNSTVSGNSASHNGGGVNNSDGTLTMTNSTVSGNTAGYYGGGVIDNLSGTLTLARTLISGNTATLGAAELGIFFGTLTAANSNLLGHNGLTNTQAFSSGFAPGVSDITATSNGTTPTALSAILDTTLANNGGPTKTHNLVSDSPAIDAVTAGCPPPTKDQRGFFRPLDGDGDATALCDIGAVEFGTDPCDGALPTSGCTVNTVPDQPCQGTSGDDTIIGTNGVDFIIGKTGEDNLQGKGGDDLLCGKGDNDTLDGGGGSDVLVGSGGDDTLKGKGGNDWLLGGSGVDLLKGGGGKDTLDGAGGNDTLKGNAGDDLLKGGGGNDELNGGTGTDNLKGGPGTDTCMNGEVLTGCEV